MKTQSLYALSNTDFVILIDFAWTAGPKNTKLPITTTTNYADHPYHPIESIPPAWRWYLNYFIEKHDLKEMNKEKRNRILQTTEVDIDRFRGEIQQD